MGSRLIRPHRARPGFTVKIGHASPRSGTPPGGKRTPSHLFPRDRDIQTTFCTACNHGVWVVCNIGSQTVPVRRLPPGPARALLGRFDGSVRGTLRPGAARARKHFKLSRVGAADPEIFFARPNGSQEHVLHNGSTPIDHWHTSVFFLGHFGGSRQPVGRVTFGLPAHTAA